MSHGDAVTEIPADFHLVGLSADCPYAAIENTERRIYGIQFHPEVRHSVYGNDILKNFAFGICGAKGDWTMENFIETEIEKSARLLGTRKSYSVYQAVWIHLLLVCFFNVLLVTN